MLTERGEVVRPAAGRVPPLARVRVAAGIPWVPFAVVGQASAAEPPSSVVGPTVSGIARDGSLLTANKGSWGGDQPISFAYQWQACDPAGESCSDIDLETLPTILLRSQDTGRRVRVKVTATNDCGSASAVSRLTEPVAARPPVNDAAPQVLGYPVLGATISAVDGVWSGSTPLGLEYQWEQCLPDGSGCRPIPGATTPVYSVRETDLAMTLRVQVRAANSAGVAAATSAPTAPVASGSVSALGLSDDEEGAPPPAPSVEEEMEHAQRFRRQLGLNDDPAYIRSLDADPALEDSRGDYGVSLTADEQRSIEARNRWTDVAYVIEKYARRFASDVYAGLYIDQVHGGVINVGVKGGVDARALADVYRFPRKLRFFNARFTIAELEAAQRRLQQDYETLRAAGIDLVSDDIDVETNVVEAIVANPSDRVRAMLEERYGEAVAMVEGEPTEKLVRRTRQDSKAGS